MADPALGHRVCPRCGLRLEVVDLGEQPILRYDFQSWKELCENAPVGGPSLCLLAERHRADLSRGR